MASASFYGYTPQVPGVSPSINVSTLVTDVTTRQLFSAIALQDDLQLLYEAVDADKNSPAWISFWTANGVKQNDDIYNLVATTYGYNNVAMAALMAKAKTLEP